MRFETTEPKIEVNLQNYKSGIYFIKIESNQGYDCHKLIVE